jgi:hypothetical protein
MYPDDPQPCGFGKLRARLEKLIPTADVMLVPQEQNVIDLAVLSFPRTAGCLLAPHDAKSIVRREQADLLNCHENANSSNPFCEACNIIKARRARRAAPFHSGSLYVLRAIQK